MTLFRVSFGFTQDSILNSLLVFALRLPFDFAQGDIAQGDKWKGLFVLGLINSSVSTKLRMAGFLVIRVLKLWSV